MDKIYLKLTTIPQTENLEEGSVEFELFKEKYSDAKEYLRNSDVMHSYNEDAAKNPSFGKIIQATLGYVNEGEIRTTIIKGEEKEILNMVFNTLKEHFSGAMLIGWNLDFIFPFLITRALKSQINLNSLPKQVAVMGLKPWARKGSLDLQSLVNCGWFKSNAQESFWTAGLPIETIVSGADVLTYYRANKEEELDISDFQYIKNLINLERISIGQEIIKNASSTIKVAEKVKPVKTKLLTAILNSGKLTEEIVNKLVEAKVKHKLKTEVILDLVTVSLTQTQGVTKTTLQKDPLYIDLSTRLNGGEVLVDYAKFSKKMVNDLIKEYEDKSPEDRLKLVTEVKEALVKAKKDKQKLKIRAFEYLNEKLETEIKL